MIGHPAKNWRYELTDGQVLWDGGSLNLTPHEATLFGLLDKAYPHNVPIERLLHAFYPDEMLDSDLPENNLGVLRTTKAVLRAKLQKANAPFEIPDAREHPNFGYYLKVKT